MAYGRKGFQIEKCHCRLKAQLYQRVNALSLFSVGTVVRQQGDSRLFIDANDYVHVLWSDNRDSITSAGSVYYTRSINGGTSYEANVNINSLGGISNGSLYVDSGIVNICITDYKTSPFSTIFYRLTWLSETAPVISSAGTASGTVNQFFSYQITATNSPTSYGASGLPAGLSVNPNTGLISGTPTASGTFNVTVTATNAGGTGSKTVMITSSPGNTGNMTILTTSLPTAEQGAAYQYALQAEGGLPPYTWSLVSGRRTKPPRGFTLTADGTLTGFPTQARTTPFAVQVTDAAGGVATRSLSLQVVKGVKLRTKRLASGTVGVPYVATLQTAGGIPPLTFSVVGGTLPPPGLTLDPATGQIAGTPTTAGTFNFQVRVTSSGGSSDQKAMRITIK